MQELIICCILLLFLFVSFIVTAVHAWIEAAIGAVCVSHFSLIFIYVFKKYILLIAPSVCGLDGLVKTCKFELDKLDVAVNTCKSCCLRIGPRNNASCLPVLLSASTVISWVNEMRYLGIFIVCSRKLKCSLEHAKKSFYRAANAVFSKIGRVASLRRGHSSVN